MPKRVMYVEGMNGQIELMDDRVVIYRKGLWNAITYGLNSVREIPLGAIVEVAFRAPGIAMGEIDFVRSGRGSVNNKQNFSAVKFNRKQHPQFEIMKEKVFDAINKIASQSKQQ